MVGALDDIVDWEMVVVIGVWIGKLWYLVMCFLQRSCLCSDLIRVGGSVDCLGHGVSAGCS